MNERFINRDESWVEFNRRVLDQSSRHIPLAEKLMFVGIASDNMDEFLMSRYVRGIPGHEEGSTYLERIHEKVRDNVEEIQERYQEIIDREGIISTRGREFLSKKVQKELETLFSKKIEPVIYPVYIRKNLSPKSKEVNILVECYTKEGGYVYSNITVPQNIEQYYWVTGLKSYMAAEDIIIYNINKIFKGFKVIRYCTYMVTRSVNMIFYDEDGDPYKTIEKSLKDLQNSWITSIRCSDTYKKKGLGKVLKNYIQNMGDNTIHFENVEHVGLHRLKGLNDSYMIEENRKRKNPIQNAFGPNSTFEIIKGGDRLVYHPFQSFNNTVVRFIEDAAEDKNVLSIKMTLYRIPRESRIINALLKAREMNKTVAVMVELKARFNEKDNLKIASVLREAGVDILYSDEEHKTHAKLCVITRKEKDKIRYYSHIGTGNYSEVNSKIYTDYSYFTSSTDIGKDLTSLFNLLSNPGADPFKSKTITYSPYNLRNDIVEEIHKQVARAKKGKSARIIIKCNSLTDEAMADELYKAGEAGVKIHLIVRGSLIIRPKVKGLSENIEATSLVGKYLEHSRVFIFGEDDAATVLIGSADMMERNLDRRYELLVRIEDEAIKERILKHIKYYLKDDFNGYELIDRTYCRKERDKVFNAHRKLENEAKELGAL